MMRFLILSTTLVLTACATSPLGRSQLAFFPDSTINEMGITAYSQMLKETPRVSDGAVSAYVNCVARAITSQLDSGGNVQWEITVFDDDAVNAFALPGGKMGVYRGLLEVAKNEHQLATVIGHEIGHVLANHANERISTAYATQTGLDLIGTLGGPPSANRSQLLGLLGVGAQVGSLKFGRTQETEADLLGLDLMARGGFDPRESIPLWENMGRAGGSKPPELLSTHPSGDTRIRNLSARMPEALKIQSQALAQRPRPACRRP